MVESVSYAELLWWSQQMSGFWYMPLLAAGSVLGGVVGIAIAVLNLATSGGNTE